jgi:soluble lytic murein transglycosylase
VRVWTEVARSQPLTWAAQVSRARLAAAGAPLPPLIDPPAVRPAQALVIDPPRPFALLASLGLDGDAEAWLAGNEQDAASRYVGRESEALCAMYGSLSRAKRRYRVGNAAVGWATLMKAPSAADRWTWECVYPRPYAAVVKALEEQYALPKGLIHSLMRQESAFDPVVLSPVSAVGLMQLMPSTARAIAGELGETYDPSLLTSPEVNVRYGAFYIAKLLKTFKGSIPLAAAAYNAGPQAVSHWLETGKDMDADLWVARIPFDETRNYVARVMGNLARYQWLDGSDAAVLPVALELPVDARAEADAY